MLPRTGFTAVVMLLASSLGATAGNVSDGDLASARRKMIADIEHMATTTATATGIQKFDQRLVDAMAEIPRHAFVPTSMVSRAYKNVPLDIGHGQTISQPFIVGLMTQLLGVESTDKVLEIGTGSGYQTAVLARLAKEVFTVEIVPELGEAAKATLDRLGYANIQTRIGDGYVGWPEAAPFDAIIVTAAPDHIPQALVDQLASGGHMVIPVGEDVQDLMVLTKQPNGTTLDRRVVPVAFVPLVRP